MIEKKYETVSEMITRIRNEPKCSYDTNERLDKQFINKDELRRIMSEVFIEDKPCEFRYAYFREQISKLLEE